MEWVGGGVGGTTLLSTLLWNCQYKCKTRPSTTSPPCSPPHYQPIPTPSPPPTPSPTLPLPSLPNPNRLSGSFCRQSKLDLPTPGLKAHMGPSTAALNY